MSSVLASAPAAAPMARVSAAAMQRSIAGRNVLALVPHRALELPVGVLARRDEQPDDRTGDAQAQARGDAGLVGVALARREVARQRRAQQPGDEEQQVLRLV